VRRSPSRPLLVLFCIPKICQKKKRAKIIALVSVSRRPQSCSRNVSPGTGKNSWGPSDDNRLSDHLLVSATSQIGPLPPVITGRLLMITPRPGENVADELLSLTGTTNPSLHLRVLAQLVPHPSSSLRGDGSRKRTHRIKVFLWGDCVIPYPATIRSKPGLSPLLRIHDRTR
jgi:hypothetical protein